MSNLEEFVEFLKGDLAVCPDAQQRVEIIFGSSDKVAVLATYVGTQKGAMGPFPPSHERSLRSAHVVVVV